MVFIDGLHTPKAVALDIALAKPRVKRGGMILFHDITLECVANAIREVFGTFTKLSENIGRVRLQ